MNSEELKKKLSEIEDKLTGIEETVADKRFYLLCESENACEVNRFLFQDVEARFAIATCIDNDDWLEVLYHYSYDQTGCVITIKAFIRDRENPQVESIATFIPAAEWIEREMHDLMGIEFKNHPDMRRLLLADDWPEGVYPMKKEVKQ
ncbi:MAG: NADH-quinone oxidoreductase subunit C [Planctomycetota bacterium]|jgi:Ni,Fe-hydrogenase III component G